MKNIIKRWWVSALPLILTGCTISVVDTHTEQGSTDSVTETLKTDPSVKAKAAVQVPVNSEAPINITPAPKASTTK